MYPVLVDLGSFQLHSYGALGALGFVLGAGICLWRARALGLDLNRFADVIFWMAIAGVVGARLTYVWKNPRGIDSWTDLLDVRGGGLVFYGSLLVGLPVGFALMRRYALPVLATFDIFATGAPLGHAISRLGCFAAGCCFGTPSDAAWAVTYPPNSPIAPAGVALHPVQIYEAAGLLAITVATNLWYSRRTADGQVFLLYLGSYALLRPLMELFRGDATRGAFFGTPLSFSQGASVLVVALAFGIWWRGRTFTTLTTSGSSPPPV